MVANRKTRSKPVAGSARTAGHALQKSTTASASEDKSDAVEMKAESEGIEVEPIVASPLKPEAVAESTAAEPVALEAELLEAELLEVELLEVDPSDSSVFLNAIVLDLDVPQDVPPLPSSVPDAPKAPAKTIPPKATQKTKGASVMTQSETPKASAVVAKAADSSKPAMQLNAVTMFYSAGERPIGASTMQVFGTILNGRPIEASSLKVFDILPGDRPVFANEVAYMTVGLPQDRPVLVSPPGMMHAQTLMGGRPIFSNDDVSDPNGEMLMGYLD
jgi:hypothetical protein